MSDSTLLVLALLIIGGMVAGILLYLAVLSPAAQERARLRAQARLDYHSARGTAHLKMMRDAHEQYTRKYGRCQTALTAAQQQKSSIKSGGDQELQSTLETHILRTRLREIPTIGPALAEQLRLYAEGHGGLQSLSYASRYVTGIGDARQTAIDAWVSNYEKQKAALLAGDFPGKAEVLTRTAAQLAAVEAEITSLTKQEVALTEQLHRLRTEIAALESVSYNDFVRALQGPPAASDALDRYLRGVFPEWEPMPEWFKEIVEGAAK